MNYKCNYKSNSTFPFNNTYKKNKKTPPKTDNTVNKNTSDAYSVFSNIFNSLLEPIEKIIGRKISFDDILLIVIIYLLYTEKDNDNNTLLICLVFILFS